MNSFAVFFVVCASLCVAYGAHLPKTFKTCSKASADYSKCLSGAIQDALVQIKDGFPTFGVPSIEPLLVETIHIGGNGGKVDIVQDYKMLKVHGFSTSEILSADLSLDGDSCKVKFVGVTPTLRLEGNYKIVGKVLILAINGIGGANITLNNMKSVHEIDCEKVTNKAGKQTLKLTNYMLDMTTEKIAYDFENLVDGNPVLSEEVSKVINESSLEIFDEIRGDYSRTFAEILKKVAGAILSKIPIEEYYLA